jgi:hypothetical protein
MKKSESFHVIITAYLIVLIFSSCVDNPKDYSQVFNIKKIAEHNPAIAVISEGTGFDKSVLKVMPTAENAKVTIWESGDPGNWTDANYLIFEIFGPNDFSGVINIEFYKKSQKPVSEKVVLQSGELSDTTEESPWLSCLMGILPRIKTKVAFPLSYLDAQNLFVPRAPRQLKGTVNGNRLDPADIGKVVLRFGPFSDPYFKPLFEVASAGLSDTLPESYAVLDKPVIDKFGQRKDKDWPVKIKNEEELISRNLELEKSVSDLGFTEGWSKYGGWKAKRFKATGFFRTQHDGQRWWLVDPEGYAFLSVGVDCIRLTSSGPVTGIEDLFEWLPVEKDAKFAESLSGNEKTKNMDFYRSNLIRVFGNEWKIRWSKMTAGLMRKLNVNTVGNWSDIDFARQNNLAYVLPLRGFPSTKILVYRDFPDVFSEEYQKNSEEFAKQLNEYKDDPYLIGYFLRNEPQWAFGYHNLAFEMFATDQASATKDEFIRWINNKYKGDIQALNKAWNVNITDFEDLKKMIIKDYPSVVADSDFYSFSTIIVKRYIDLPCDEVARVDKNHLNLGMRYAWLSSDLLYKAGERFDVFSINGYGYSPPSTAEIARISGKPVMIGEFHHGAVDRALPATGITGVISQDERAAAYRNYIEHGFARPELIGMHYFQWVDQPYYGRFDGENYNIGVVTMNNLPYPELTGAMEITNKRIYEVGSGAAEPFGAEIIRIPSIHY